MGVCGALTFASVTEGVYSPAQLFEAEQVGITNAIDILQREVGLSRDVGRKGTPVKVMKLPSVNTRTTTVSKVNSVETVPSSDAILPTKKAVNSVVKKNIVVESETVGLLPGSDHSLQVQPRSSGPRARAPSKGQEAINRHLALSGFLTSDGDARWPTEKAGRTSQWRDESSLEEVMHVQAGSADVGVQLDPDMYSSSSLEPDNLKLSTLAKCISLKVKRTHVSVLPVAECFVQIPNSKQSRLKKLNAAQRFAGHYDDSFETNRSCSFLLDTGSSDTYVRACVVEELNLPIVTRTTFLRSTIDGGQTEVTFPVVRLGMSSPVQNFCFQTYALVTPDLVEIPPICITVPRSFRGKLSSAELLDRTAEIDILLGVDAFPHIVYGEIISEGNLSIIHSYFGPLLLGTAGTAPGGRTGGAASHVRGLSQAESSCSSDESRESLNQLLENHWNLESIGIRAETSEEASGLTDDEMRALKLLKEGTKFEDGQYFLPMLWKDQHRPVNNYRLALVRLFNLEKRLLKPALRSEKEAYNQEVRLLLENGRAVRIPDIEVKNPDRFFLPHRAVAKHGGKIRIVFDASARDGAGVPLNERLLPGFRTQNELPGILMRLRFGAVVVSLDIKQMFHGFKIREEETKYQSFIWRDCDTSATPTLYALLTCVQGAKDSPFKCIQTTRDHLLEHIEDFRETVESAIRDSYVDDICSVWPTVETAHKFVMELVEILAKAGLGLYKLVSNSQNLIELLPREMRCEQTPLTFTDGVATAADLDPTTSSSTLGVGWDPSTDLFCYTGFSRIVDERPLTKRTLASQMAKVWDPLGLLGPFTVTSKILVRECHLLGVGWDELVPPRVTEPWNEWASQLSQFTELAFPRTLWKGNSEPAVERQLHICTDASEEAMCAAAYLRSTYEDGSVSVDLLMSKTKLAPMKAEKGEDGSLTKEARKSQSIPRLELIAALMGARLSHYVSKELDLDQSGTRFWTDSLTVMHWLNKPASTWKIFVARRVKEIQDSTQIRNWSWIAGTSNSSDLATRGITLRELSKGPLHEFWFHGPEFLITPASEWPVTHLEHLLPETARADKAVVAAAVRSEPELKGKIALFRCFEMCTTLERAISSFRTMERLARAQRPFYTHARTRSEWQRIVLLACALTQKDSFKSEYDALARGRDANDEHFRKSKLLPLNPFFDVSKSVIRSQTRLQEAPDLSPEEKNPVILPGWKKSRFVYLLIMHYHVINKHAPAAWTRSFLSKEGFHILRAGKCVSEVIHRCQQCKRFNAKSGEQIMATLPAGRLDPRPFKAVGMDVAGPYSVYLENEDGSKYKSKSYVNLFTDMATRGVILDFIPNLTYQSLLLSVRRLIAMRGCPDVLRSDNFRSYVRVDKEIQALWQEVAKKFPDEPNLKGIEWTFSTSKAPHTGGFYEALVKLLKASMKRALGHRVLSHTEFLTVLAEIQQSINNRPLTAERTESGYRTVTPNMLLFGYNLSPMPMQPTFHKSKCSEPLLRWKQRQEASRHLWNVWKETYLEELKRRAKWHKTKPEIAEGTIVLIGVDTLPRIRWPLAVVEKVHIGRDGKIRKVTLRTAKGHVERAVQSIYPLENDIVQQGENSQQGETG